MQSENQVRNTIIYLEQIRSFTQIQVDKGINKEYNEELVRDLKFAIDVLEGVLQ